MALAIYAETGFVPLLPGAMLAPVPQRAFFVDSAQPAWQAALALIELHLPFVRRTLRPGDSLQRPGDRFTRLHVIHLGALKTSTTAANGREQVADLYLKGDWIGLDGIASGYHICAAHAIDTSEVWSLRYEVLLDAAARAPELLHAMHIAMSRQCSRDCAWRFALASLPAEARVADFLCSWSQALAERAMRADHIQLHLTRAEIGNYLGLALETVSRAFSGLVRRGLIRFDDPGRRYVAVPSISALIAYVETSSQPGALRRMR